MLYSESQHVHLISFTSKTIQGYASQIEESQDIQLTPSSFPHLSWFQSNLQRKTTSHDLSKSAQILSGLMLKDDLGNPPAKI